MSKEQEIFPTTLWYSTLGMGDGHDFATRGYLRALMNIDFFGLRIPPSISTSVLMMDEKADPEITQFAELTRPPEVARMKPLKLIEAGDPRIGTTRVIPGTDLAGNPKPMEITITEGSIDLDVEQEYTSSARQEVRSVVIHHDPGSIARHFTTLTKRGKPNRVGYVGVTVWETSHIPDAVAMILNELHAIVVPSYHSRQALLRSGVDIPVEVVPHTFDPELWPQPTEADFEHSRDRDRYVFYTIATPIERKNLKGLMRAYFKAFEGRDDVVLRVKIPGQKVEIRELANKALEEAKITGKRPPVNVFGGNWPTEKIRAFHLNGDCYVSANRAEGFGLCLLPGTLVTTRSGVKCVEHIYPGEEVLSHDGDWYPVTNTSQRIAESFVDIRCKGLPSLKVTDEHPVLVAHRKPGHQQRDFEKNPSVEWVKAQDVQVGDYLVLRGPATKPEGERKPSEDAPAIALVDYAIDPVVEGDKFTSRYSNRADGQKAADVAKEIGISLHTFRNIIQPSASKRFVSEDIQLRNEEVVKQATDLGYFDQKVWLPCFLQWTPELCRIVAYYAAEGSACAEMGATEFSFNTYSKLLCSQQVGEFMDNIGVTYREKLTPGTKKLGIVCSSSVIASMFVALCGGSSYAKRLPDVIWKLDRECQIETLSALIRTDGSHDGHSMRFSSTSKVLAFQARDLFLSLGIPASIRPYRRLSASGGTFILWHVAVMGKYREPAMLLLGLDPVERKAKTDRTGSHFVPFEDTWLTPVTEVEHVQMSSRVYNLQVEGSETFVANGAIVHNCELEAKLCGSRVITSEWGAAKEFLQYREVIQSDPVSGSPYRGLSEVQSSSTTGNDILIPCELIPVQGMYGIGCYDEDQKWADPNEEALIEAMRQAASSRLPPDLSAWPRLRATLDIEQVGQHLGSVILRAREEADEQGTSDAF